MPADNDHYVKLLALLDKGQDEWMDEHLNDPGYTGEVDVSLRKYMLDAIWPEFEKRDALLRKIVLRMNDDWNDLNEEIAEVLGERKEPEVADDPYYVDYLNRIGQTLAVINAETGGLPAPEQDHLEAERVLNAIWSEIDKLRYRTESAESALHALGVLIVKDDDHFEVVVPQDLLDVINARPPLCEHGCGPMRNLHGMWECLSDHK